MHPDNYISFRTRSKCAARFFSGRTALSRRNGFDPWKQGKKKQSKRWRLSSVQLIACIKWEEKPKSTEDTQSHQFPIRPRVQRLICSVALNPRRRAGDRPHSVTSQGNVNIYPAACILRHSQDPPLLLPAEGRQIGSRPSR